RLAAQSAPCLCSVPRQTSRTPWWCNRVSASASTLPRPPPRWMSTATQDVQKVIPEAVTENSKGYLLVNNDPIIWAMLNALKEQQQQIRKERSRVRAQEAAIRELKSQLHETQQRLAKIKIQVDATQPSLVAIK